MRLTPHLPLLLSLSPTLASSTCFAGVHVFQARATTEPQHMSVSDVPTNATVNAIADSFHTRLVYPANQSIPLSSNMGTTTLSEKVNNYHKECPDGKIAFIGFSQGAMVIGNAMTGGIEGVEPFSEAVRKNIVGIILYGDPQRQGNQDYGRDTCDTDGGGLREGEQAGLFNSYSNVLLSYCDKDDPVCCKTGTDWIRHVTYFTQENGQEVAQFIRANYELAKSRFPSSHIDNLPVAVTPQAVVFVRQHYIILSAVGIFLLLNMASRARWRRVYLRLP